MKREEEIVTNLQKKGKLSDYVKEKFTTKYLTYDKIVVVLVQIGEITLKGVAICSPKDNYSLEFGKRIAFADAVRKR